jgi:hypothetical protein
MVAFTFLPNPYLVNNVKPTKIYISKEERMDNKTTCDGVLLL